ncbi:ABC transporter ATP-binding protein [Fenollaria sporofastidiosus]|uniref:ABC transporter ATP-binding protein n=1 Tax=Fenollaria sporofastidiosus TaxID=2811778 RepID=UPI001C000BE6|nr:dipeptide/oligopeptide/nickel ABC transporter ATP-binding protein [Fenollaria sporofastidiosus]
MEKILEIKNLKKSFKMSDAPTISDLNLDLYENEFLGIIGPSGSGKTTLLRLIAGLIVLDKGEILYKGRDLPIVGDKRRNLEDFPVQLIFQNAVSSFDSKKTIMDSFKEALHFSKKDLNLDELKELMDEFELDESALDKRPYELSGGMISRAQIIRALLTQPKVLLADEITSPLDVNLKLKTTELLDSYRKKHGMSIILVSHDVQLLEHACDRVVSINDIMVRAN